MVKDSPIPILAGLALWSSAALADSAVQATPGVLSVEMRAGGGRLTLQADGFQESPPPQSGGRGARTLLPSRFRIVLSGEQTAAYSVSGGQDPVKDWVSRHEVRVKWDDEISGVLEPAAFEDWAEAVRAAPVQVRLGEGENPLVEISVERVVPGLSPAWKLTRRNDSVRTKVSRSRMLRDGKWIEGDPQPEEAAMEPRIGIHIGSGREGGRPRHGRLQGPDFVFEDEELRVPAAWTDQRLIAGGKIEVTSQSDPLPGVSGGFGEVPLDIQWRLSLGAPPDVGWFEEIAAGPAPWLPTWGGSRDFVLKLTKLERIEEIEIRLDGVSQCPGVAVNGGRAVASQASGWRDQLRPVPVELRDGDFVLRWNRLEPVPPSHEEDSGPDLFFTAADHPGFAADPVGERVSRLVSKSVKDEIPVRVRSADWAASGRLGVKVKVDGIWEILPPRGAGIPSGSETIGIPADGDGDGLPDGFGPVPGGGESDADGDGIAPALEYRGIVAGGKHRRLSPARREVFVSDFHEYLGEEERIALGRRVTPWGVDLIFLERGETVLPGIPVIAIEPLQSTVFPQILRIEDPEGQRQAFRALRPRPGIEALFFEGKADPAVLAGDLARILQIAEFGSQP